MSTTTAPTSATITSVHPSRDPARNQSAAELSGHWVDAAPFRAYLRHLVDSTGLPWQEVAAVARISVPDARRLLTGRRGKPVRRVSPETARRIFWIDHTKLARAAGVSGRTGRAARPGAQVAMIRINGGTMKINPKISAGMVM